MAGIGFELRRLLADERSFGVFRAYAYAGVISSGPWVVSIFGVMSIGLLARRFGATANEITPFLVSVTYLVACSLILTGGLQLMYTRFTADRLFERRRDLVLPNLIGAMVVVTLVSGMAALACLAWLFRGVSLSYEVLMFTGFVVLNNLWMTVVFLTGMKEYRFILFAFAVGYAVAIFLSLSLADHGVEGLLAGFVAGQGVLLFLLLWLVARNHPARTFLSFEVFDKQKSFYSLALSGVLLNLGIWADKFLFWFNPATSTPVIGPLRASYIYDFPIFLAYLSIIPGMAVFLVRMETDFVEQYQKFYDAVRDGGTLNKLEYFRNGMVTTVRQGMYEIFKIQGITILLAMLLGPAMLRLFGISRLYLPLFNIDLVGVSLQVLFMALTNVLFYLDRRITVAWLFALFFLSNVALTLLSQALGPVFYGYGFALSLLMSCLAALIVLGRCFDRLEYETFMLQR